MFLVTLVHILTIFFQSSNYIELEQFSVDVRLMLNSVDCQAGRAGARAAAARRPHGAALPRHAAQGPRRHARVHVRGHAQRH